MAPDIFYLSDGTFGEGSYIVSFGTEYRGEAVGAFGDRTAVINDYQLKVSDFGDRTSNTFLVGEVDNSLNWVDSSGNKAPADFVPFSIHTWAQGYFFTAQGNTEGVFNRSGDTLFSDVPEFRTFRSDHPGGVNFGFADGSVHFISDSIEAVSLDKLLTRDGGELVALP